MVSGRGGGGAALKAGRGRVSALEPSRGFRELLIGPHGRPSDDVGGAWAGLGAQDGPGGARPVARATAPGSEVTLARGRGGWSQGQPSVPGGPGRRGLTAGGFRSGRGRGRGSQLGSARNCSACAHHMTEVGASSEGRQRKGCLPGEWGRRWTPLHPHSCTRPSISTSMPPGHRGIEAPLLVPSSLWKSPLLLVPDLSGRVGENGLESKTA